MASTSSDLAEQLELAEQLWAGRYCMDTPQDLPGRFGRVVRAIDHVLQSVGVEAVVAGGWAVWHHGYVERVTRDVDIVLGASSIDEFRRVASVSGFDLEPDKPGRWPKLRHKETGIRVDILPEGARPGTDRRPAPTTIPHPSKMGAVGSNIRYVNLEHLFELKLAAGRTQDIADLEHLARDNLDRLDSIRKHLISVHPDYLHAFDDLVARSQLDTER
jgi:predicted nucleotidyltransferase